MNIINIEHISKIFGGKVIFDDVSCGISEGEKIGVIGINGTGKTTLLRVLAGLEQPDEGQVITQNGIRIAYLQQNSISGRKNRTFLCDRWYVGHGLDTAK